MPFSLNAKKDTLALFLQDAVFFKTAVPLVPGDFFSAPEMRFIYEACRKFYDDHGGVQPHAHELRDILDEALTSAKVDSDTIEVVDLFVTELLAHTAFTASYVKKNLYTFLTTHHISKALGQAQDLLDIGNFDKIVQVISKARSCATEDAPPLDYFGTVEERAEERKYRKRKAVITGFSGLDVLTDGGLPRGNTSLIIAPTGRGKTAILGRTALTACALGYKVLFVTLELDPFVISDRLDSSICNIDIKLLRLQATKVVKRLNHFIGSRGPHVGDLRIQKKQARKFSASDLDAYLEKLSTEEDFTPDMVVVDYADRMRWDTDKGVPFWQQLEHLMDDLRNIAEDRHLALWTATQAKASAADKEEITNEDAGSAYAKTFSPDLVISASQTKKEARNNMMRLYIAKSRLGGQGANIYLKTNFDRMRFEEMPKEEYERMKLKYGISETKKRSSRGSRPSLASGAAWEDDDGDI